MPAEARIFAPSIKNKMENKNETSKEVFLVIIVFIALFILGLNNPKTTGNRDVGGIPIGQNIGGNGTVIGQEAVDEKAEMPLENKFNFGYRRYFYSNDPDKEYLEIKAAADNKETVNITKWRIRSAESGKSYEIGQGVFIPFLGGVNYKDDIFLAPSQRLIITTGKSPINFSFFDNKCMGYFEQFKDFSVPIEKRCPTADQEKLPARPNQLSDKCLDYIESVPRCEIITNFPIDLDPQCKTFVSERASYPKCLELHRSDSDFLGDIWRVYLGRSERIWKDKRETIEFVDEAGKVLDSISY